jgi:hypothetical protein
VAAIAVGLPGIMGVAYFWPSTIPTIRARRFAIRPPQIKEWSAGWNKGQHAKPFLANKSTLSEDQVAVYRAFMKSYGAGGRERFNVGNLTRPLEIADADMRACLKGLKPEPLAEISGIHRLTPAVFGSEKVRIVDAARQALLIAKVDPSRTIRDGKSVDDAVETAFSAGLLELSEVAFAIDRQFAVMNFSFSCGGLCGHGGTLVFERSGQEWKRSDRNCSSYVS